MFQQQIPFGAARMHHARAYESFHLETQIAGGASPHRLIAMLFDGVFDCIAQGKGAMRNGDIATKNRALGKAVRIVEEGLRASLDLTAGGKLARDLHELYGYVALRLTRANLRNDEKAIDECAGLLQPLREAWMAIQPPADA
jgi:flagellar protein FliS